MTAMRPGLFDLPALWRGWRAERRRIHGSATSVAAGVGGMVSLWFFSIYFIATADYWAGFLAVAVLPFATLLVLHGWVFNRLWMMAAGIAGGFLSFALPWYVGWY